MRPGETCVTVRQDDQPLVSDLRPVPARPAACGEEPKMGQGRTSAVSGAAVPAGRGGRAEPGRARCPPVGGAGCGAPWLSCGVRPAAGPARPGRPAGPAGDVAGAGAGACPLRPDDGLPVQLFPRRSPADGQRPGRHPVSGLAVQACGVAHLSNFDIFGSAERHLCLRRQRLRQDAARPVGMGRQAAGRRSAFASSVVSTCTGM